MNKAFSIWKIRRPSSEAIPPSEPAMLTDSTKTIGKHLKLSRQDKSGQMRTENRMSYGLSRIYDKSNIN